MKQKTLGLIVLVVCLSLGVLIGSFVGMYMGQLTVPVSHKTIIDAMKVTDTKANLQLTPKFACSKTITLWQGVPLSNFEIGENYVQSTWFWQRYDDTEFVMCICGPGNDGKTYQIEFGKVAAEPFTITFGGVIKITIPARTDYALPTDIGFYWFEVQVS